MVPPRGPTNNRPSGAVPNSPRWLGRSGADSAATDECHQYLYGVCMVAGGVTHDVFEGVDTADAHV
jgi:hypothetical protein